MPGKHGNSVIIAAYNSICSSTYGNCFCRYLKNEIHDILLDYHVFQIGITCRAIYFTTKKYLNPILNEKKFIAEGSEYPPKTCSR